MDFSKLKSLVANSIRYKKDLTNANCHHTSKNEYNQVDNSIITPETSSGVMKKQEKYVKNQQYHTEHTDHTFTTDTLENTKSNSKPNNLKENEVKGSGSHANYQSGVSGVFGVIGVFGVNNNVTTREEIFDLSSIYSINIPSHVEQSSITPLKNDGVFGVISFDELGYVNEKYDHLSDQYQSQPGSFWSRYTKQVEITPQQALEIEEISDLERQVVDFLKKYGDFGLKHIAKKLKRNEQEIRNIVQNSALIEYRKSNFDGVVYESLLLKEVNYPARLVTFVELRRDLTIDDILKILEECESFIKHHDKDHLDEWVEFCTRFVKFYRDGDNLIASLKTALIKIQLIDQL